ncbi:MAG TPA: hypothetical protein PL029_11135 [Bacteroidia bacterium]|nr:hypothetical protein [Bacteroidia bacterium]
MKTRPLPYFMAFLLFVSFTGLSAQNAGSKPVKSDSAYPESFTIVKKDFDRLFLYKPEELVSKNNSFINKGRVKMNAKNGDMKFLKIKLNYFKNAVLMVQVNGSASTQAFVVSSDKSVFYKGHFQKNDLVMIKCAEDDIVNE